MKKILLTATILSTLAISGAYAQGREDAPDFAELDANSDGQLTLEELQAQGAARFAAADINGDGVLSADELTGTEADKAAERAARMIERLDTNEDGVLQQTEMQQRGGDRLERRFERIDRDDDGQVSEDEFERVMERRGGRKGKGRGHGRRGRG